MLVLDANLLIRAVLESRVLGLLRNYAGQVSSCLPTLPFRKRESIYRISWRGG